MLQSQSKAQKTQIIA